MARLTGRRAVVSAWQAFGAIGIGICAVASGPAASPLATRQIVTTIEGPASPSSDELLRGALDRAEEARRANPDADVVIELGSGTYRLSAPLVVSSLAPEPEHGRLILRAAPKAVVTIAGSRNLVGAQPAREMPALKDRLPQSASRDALAFTGDRDVRSGFDAEQPRGLRYPAHGSGLLLFQGNQMLRFARWPSDGYATLEGDAPSQVVPADQLAAWSKQGDLWIEGYWEHDWLYATARLSADQTGQLQFPPFHPSEEAPVPRFAVLNAVADLDAAGEFSFVKADDMLVVRPFAGDTAPIEIAVADSIIVVEASAHVQIEGIAIEKSKGNAIVIHNSSDVALTDCFVGNAGGSGIVVSGGSDDRIEHTVVADVGETGISLSGGDRAALTPARHRVSDSVVARFGQLTRSYRPGIELAGVGQSVSGSFLTEAPHSAIIFAGNDHVIAGNEIARVMTETSDAGAIMGGRDWTARGTVIRQNYIHDILPGTWQPKVDVKGVYIDDQMSGETVERNLFYRTMQPVFISGGRDNVVVDNTIIGPDFGKAAIQVDDRGLTWQAADVADPSSQLRRRLAAVPYASDLWQKRYPTLSVVLSDHPGAPIGNILGPNVVLGGSRYHFTGTALQSQGMRPDPVGVRVAASVDLTAPRPSDLQPFTCSGASLGPAFAFDDASLDRRVALRTLRFAGRVADVLADPVPGRVQAPFATSDCADQGASIR